MTDLLYPTQSPVVHLGRGIADDLREYAGSVLTRVLAHRGFPAAPVRAHVERHGTRPHRSGLSATVLVQLDGRRVAVHLYADTPREAVDLLAARLDRRLERLSRTTRQGGGPLTTSSSDADAYRPPAG